MRSFSMLAKSCAVALAAGILLAAHSAPAGADETPILNDVTPAPVSSTSANAPNVVATVSPLTPPMDEAAVASSLVEHPCSAIGDIATTVMITHSACIVAPGHQMLELGFTQSQLKIGNVQWNSTSLPEALFRIGTSVKNLEAQVTAPDYTHWNVKSGGVGNSGSHVSGISVGARYQLGSTGRFTHSVQANIGLGNNLGNVTAGDPEYYLARSGAVLDGLYLSYEAAYQINSKLTAVGSIGDYGSVEGLAPSLGLKAQLPAEFTGFVEVQPSSVVTQFGIGVSRPLGDHMLVHGEYTTMNFADGGIGSKVTSNSINAGVSIFH